MEAARPGKGVVRRLTGQSATAGLSVVVGWSKQLVDAGGRRDEQLDDEVLDVDAARIGGGAQPGHGHVVEHRADDLGRADLAAVLVCPHNFVYERAVCPCRVKDSRRTWSAAVEYCGRPV